MKVQITGVPKWFQSKILKDRASNLLRISKFVKKLAKTGKDLRTLANLSKEEKAPDTPKFRRKFLKSQIFLSGIV